jgi:hypothetical protein
LASSAFAADDAKKPKHWTPGYNDPSIGVLGANKTPGAPPVNRNAAPPAPSAAPALPKVDAEAATMSGLNSQTVVTGAAPRPEAQVEGGSGTDTTAVRGSMPGAAQPPQVNTFLATHLVISGLIAGLIGSDLGSILYGGPMMGDETAAMMGFILRIGLVLGIAVLTVRVIWGLIGGGRRGDDYLPAAGPRREPSFGRREDSFDGRREPTFERSDEARTPRGRRG